MRIDRMLGITVLLLGRDRVTARELSERFEVSIRTVYRDLEALQQAGIPVVCLPGKGGGYSLMDNYKVDRRLLSFDDMVAILTALKGANAAVQSPLMESTIDKIRSLIPRDKSSEASLHLEQLVIDYLPWGNGKRQQERLRLVHHAINANRLVKLIYRNLRGEVGARIVEPMTLLFKGYSWYLSGYCRTREDYRLFRLSRIVSVEELQETFIRRPEIHPYFPESRGPAFPPVHLVLRFASEVRLRVEEYFDEDAIALCEDGCCLVTVDWPEDEWIYDTLLSFGEHVTVLEPPHVRQSIRRRLLEALDLYKP